jgi:hypothetical protein
MLLFLSVENHYAGWGWGEKVEKVRCQVEKGVARRGVARGEGREDTVCN